MTVTEQAVSSHRCEKRGNEWPELRRRQYAPDGGEDAECESYRQRMSHGKRTERRPHRASLLALESEGHREEPAHAGIDPVERAEAEDAG